MPDPFRVVILSPDAALNNEAMGTKEKFWCKFEETRCLFKLGRPDTGENWSEKLAAELAQLLGIPHADVDFATHLDRRGVLSYNVLPSKRAGHIMGNALLRRFVKDYPLPRADHGRQRTSKHLVDAVASAIEGATPLILRARDLPRGVVSDVGIFLGYLLFDAWIGNTDRHDENWALVVEVRPEVKNKLQLSLSPTFDHASSLGRELRDERRSRILQEDSMAEYVAKCRSALYESLSDRKAMSPLAAFVHLGRRHPLAAVAWLDRLAQISEESVQLLIDRVPPDWMSQPARQFAKTMLDHTKAQLLDRRGEFVP